MNATHFTAAVAAAAHSKAGWAHHTHTVTEATGSAICGKVKAENILDDACATDPEAKPTCPVCARRDPRFQ